VKLDFAQLGPLEPEHHRISPAGRPGANMLFDAPAASAALAIMRRRR
jgi:hypothetical protein